MTPFKKCRHISGSCDPIKQEITGYLISECVDIDPLKYWKDNAEKYPRLTCLARTFLVVPATSAPVERLFSIAGKFFRPERCRLSDKTFERLLMNQMQ